jgi:hypothetical protein
MALLLDLLFCFLNLSIAYDTGPSTTFLFIFLLRCEVPITAMAALIGPQLPA